MKSNTATRCVGTHEHAGLLYLEAEFWNNTSYSSRGMLLDYWPLKMGPICWPETSVRNYPYRLRNVPEERRSN